MNFTDFLEKYYLPYQQSEIVILLNNISAYQTIEYTINEYYKSIEGHNKHEIISQLVLTIRDYITAINKGLQTIEQDCAKATAEMQIIELSIYLIKETYNLSSLDRTDYFDILKQTIKKIYKKYSWDFSVLDSLLNLENLKNYSKEYNKQESISELKLSKPIQIDWKGSLPLDYFIDDLVKVFKCIKSKSSVYKLFDKIDDDFEIYLSSKYLLAFLSLFYELHQCHTILVVGNRGLFVYFQRHLKPPKYDKYQNREFRKLRHEAFQNEKTKNEISKIIKPLLDKYCNQGR
ncbi:MAG: hypothetical protein WC868_03915 [Bacteroidales bacterium]